MDILSEEFVYSESMLDAPGAIAKCLDYLEHQSVIAGRDGKYRIQPEKRNDIILFAKAVQDFLESYLVVCDCVIQLKKRLSRKELLYEVRKNGIKLFHLGDVKLAESLSVPNYEHALVRLDRAVALEKVPSGRKQLDVQVKDLEKVIEMKNRIERYLKPLQKL